MSYSNFTPDQKVLAQTVAEKVERSGCNTDQIVEVLCEVAGSLLAYMAPSKAELAQYLDDKLLPYLRRTALGWHDIKNLMD